MQLSDEQSFFIKRALEGNNILVDACIGSGKTTAIQHLCDEYPENTKILYLTYNKLLKIDAKEKIKKKNVLVTNYHGFAYMHLARAGIRSGISDLIQIFINRITNVSKYDVLIIDEYQDIETELAEMLNIVKSSNPDIQIIAVGDMEQKIYDKTTLNVRKYIEELLGKHLKLEFTQCFRLSAEHAAKLGRIWNKKIVGVNENCEVLTMSEDDIVEYLAEQAPEDVLCLGARTGSMADTLNELEDLYPDKYNKYTVYASIMDSDTLTAVEPSKETAIFTTFDSSKGLERKIVVVFDYTEGYWSVRLNKPQQSYKILRNIFCVAASRGKEKIIFVDNGEGFVSEKSLSTPYEESSYKHDDVDISSMFDFKYKEDVEKCFSLIKTKKLKATDENAIDIKSKDGLIDLSPCIGIYQEASFFKDYDIEDDIRLQFDINADLEHLYSNDIKNSTVERKILFLTSLSTRQNRYMNQVDCPFILEEEKELLKERLLTTFTPYESVQKQYNIPFYDKNRNFAFTAKGMVDVIKDDIIYELKFVNELTHEHFLQCASYIVASGLKKGRLWNTRTNEMYEITVPDKKAFLNAVAKTITKGIIDKYY